MGVLTDLGAVVGLLVSVFAGSLAVGVLLAHHTASSRRDRHRRALMHIAEMDHELFPDLTVGEYNHGGEVFECTKCFQMRLDALNAEERAAKANDRLQAQRWLDYCKGHGLDPYPGGYVGYWEGDGTRMAVPVPKAGWHGLGGAPRLADLPPMLGGVDTGGGTRVGLGDTGLSRGA